MTNKLVLKSPQKGAITISNKTSYKKKIKNDSARIRNLAPESIKSSASLSTAKKNIKNYILNLPI